MATSSTKYAKVQTTITLSRDSSYSDPMVKETHTDEWTYTRHLGPFEILAETGGTTVAGAPFATLDDVIVTNLDATNFVDVTYTNTPGGAGIDTRIPAGQTVRLGSAITAASDLLFTADTAACEIVVYAIGD